MSDKSLLYICGWKPLPSGGFEGWVLKRPKVRATCTDLDDLMMQLTYAIEAAYDDDEPQIEFEPPLHQNDALADCFSGNHVTIGPNSHFNMVVEVGQTLFDRGICSECLRSWGTRTDVPIVIQSMWPGDFSYGCPVGFDAHVLIAAERFLDLLTAEERETFELRPVVMPPRSRKKFFEMVPRNLFKPVSVTAVEDEITHCSTCGSIHIRHLKGADVCTTFIERRPLPTVFAVGTPVHYHLGVRGDRWAAAKADFRSLKASSDPLGLVAPEQCRRIP